MSHNTENKMSHEVQRLPIIVPIIFILFCAVFTVHFAYSIGVDEGKIQQRYADRNAFQSKVRCGGLKGMCIVIPEAQECLNLLP